MLNKILRNAYTVVFIKLCVIYWIYVFLCLCIFHVGGNVLIRFTFVH